MIEIQRTQLRRGLFMIVSILALILTAGGLAMVQSATAAHDDPVPDGDDDALIAAITHANIDGGTVTLAEGGEYMLTEGLPIIRGNVTIEGNGATIRRRDDEGTLSFRIFTVESPGDLNLHDVTISGGNANSGGGIRNGGGKVTLTNSTVSGNTATDSTGGGIYNSQGDLTLINSTVSGNTITAFLGDGGGIYNFRGDVTLINSTVSGNTVSEIDGRGGGIYNDGTLTLTNSTVSGNIAPSPDGRGGGITNLGTLTLTNSTVSGNTANNSGYGGGIYNDGTLMLTGAVVAGNSASYSPEIHNTDSVSGTYNLIGDDSGMSGIEDGEDGNQVGTGANPIDPLLGLLQDNGGPTETMLPLEGSPLIDAISLDNGDCVIGAQEDQRGIDRPQGAGCDIGAVEVEQVIDPEPELPTIDDVRDTIDNLDLNRGTERSVLAQLDSAERSLERGNVNAGCGQLGAFINSAESRIGDDAADLIEMATQIRDELGC